MKMKTEPLLLKSKTMTETKREEMIAAIAEDWVDGIDIKDYLRSMLIEYTEQLEAWSDNDIEEEYKLVHGNYEQESQRH